MSKRDEKSRGSGLLLISVIGLMVPVLYVLGIGPAYAIAIRYPATKNFLAAVYRPVIYAGEHCEPIRGLFDWYMEFWM